MSKDKGKRLDTKVVDGGRRQEWRGQMVNVPVCRTSTMLFDSVADLHSASPPRHGRTPYGLQGTATHWSLAEALTELEPGAAGTALAPSGLAAITAAVTAVVSAGDELLVVDSCYGPTRHFCDSILTRFGVAVRYYDPLAGADEVEALLSPKTRAILMESPGSQTFEVQDVPGICAMARRLGIVTLLDNTWATPLLFPAHGHGVDISIMACTKYVAGHSDLLLGSVSATPDWFDRVQQTMFDLGHSVGADDAYLAARGLRTLHLRLRRHEESALRIARWLAGQPQVGTVLHPALEGCPGHSLWKRDFGGSSSLFSFTLNKGGLKAATRLVDSLEQFGIGYSFGGFESLATVARPKRTASRVPHDALVRLHVGLEDADDLIADLAAALGALAPTSGG